MSKKIEMPPSTDRTHHRKLSQRSMDDLGITLQTRINSMIELDGSLNQKLKLLQSNKLGPRDLQLISLSLQEMIATLQKVSVNEIQFQQTNRENERMKLELSQIRLQHNRIAQQMQLMQKQHSEMSEKYRNMEIELTNTSKKLMLEIKKGEDLSKRLRRSEERVKIILESNITIQQDNLKLTLLEALQENEHFKKEALQKQKDIQKLNLNNSLLQQKLARLNNRFNSLGKQSNEQEFIDQEKMVITFTEIPKNFLFRHVFLNNECKQFIQSTLEYSNEEFVSHMNSITPELRKIQLTWLFAHLVNNRDFCQSHNTFLIKLTQLNLIKTHEALHEFVTNLSQFLKVTHCILWIRDYWTGLYVSYQNGQYKKIMCSRGSFKDCLDMKEAINKLTAQRHLMYQNDKGDDVMQEDTYLYPILMENALPPGLIEFQHPTQANNYSDIQYFASILGHFVKQIVERIELETQREKIVKQNDLVLAEFYQLISCTEKEQFYIQMKEMQFRLLQMSTCELIFIENQKMWKYGKDGIISMDRLTGVSGLIAKTLQPAFFQNISKEVQFNSIVDLYSIAPVYVYPIVKNNLCYAVIELTLTNRQIGKHRFKDPLVSLQQQSNQAKMFCESVATAFICKFV